MEFCVILRGYDKGFYGKLFSRYVNKWNQNSLLVDLYMHSRPYLVLMFIFTASIPLNWYYNIFWGRTSRRIFDFLSNTVRSYNLLFTSFTFAFYSGKWKHPNFYLHLLIGFCLQSNYRKTFCPVPLKRPRSVQFW